jgi:hypothetical protein
MANMVDAAWAKAMVLASRWLGVVVLTVFMFGRAAAASARRLWSTWSTSAGRLPPVGQQLLDPAVQLHRHAREDVLQVGPRVVPVELGRLAASRSTGKVATAGLRRTDKREKRPSRSSCRAKSFAQVNEKR